MNILYIAKVQTLEKKYLLEMVVPTEKNCKIYDKALFV